MTFLRRMLKKKKKKIVVILQTAYYAEMAAAAEIENIKPVLTKIVHCSVRRSIEDLLNYRKDVYQVVDDETFIHLT